MKRQFKFCCPNCKALFPVEAHLGKFGCHRCGQTFTMVDLGKRGRGWISDQCHRTGPAVSQIIHPLKKLPRWHPGDQMTPPPDVPQMGAARLRRQRRRAMRRPVSLLSGILLVVLVGLAVISPGVVQGHTDLPDEPAPTSLKTQAVISPAWDGTPTRTSSPAPTLTSTPIPSPSPTATPLTENQVIATAWQATVEQAASFSHATQTQVVERLSATQTSLPVTLTVMARDRDAVATEKAFSATATAGARHQTKP